MWRVLVIGALLLLAGVDVWLRFTYPADKPLLNEAAPTPGLDLHSRRAVEIAGDANRVISDIRRRCEESKLSFVGNAPFVLDWADFSPDSSTLTGQKRVYANFGSEDQHFGLTYENGNCRLRNYQNLALEKLPETHALFDPPDQPKLTREEAIQVATKFLATFADPTTAHLGSPTATYDHTGRNYDDKDHVTPKAKRVMKTYLGYWMVRWPRVDSHGYQIAGNGVNMMFHEGFGPMCVGIYLDTPYQEEAGDPIKKEDALGVVKRRLIRANFWSSVESFLPWRWGSSSWTETTSTKSYLQIISPHNDANAPARLAWVFWFRTHWDHAHCPVCVYVDAHTDEILGGDIVTLLTPD